jgi:non-lysosomal glucosylceramidase
MADQLAGQWYADATGLGDLVAPDRVELALRTVHRMNVEGFAGGRMGAVNGVRPDGTVDDSSEQSAEVWVGTTYALAAFMLGRGLTAEAWQTAWGAYDVTYNRGLWFRTPEAYDEAGNFRASLYLRPLAIWAIEHALRDSV